MRKIPFHLITELPDKLGPTQRKLLKIVGYPSFALFCFFFFLVHTFPLEPIRQKIVSYAESEMKLNVEFGKLSTSFPLGIKAKNITITSKDEQNPAFPLTIKYLQLDVSILPLFAQRQVVDFDLETFGGEFSGTAKVDKKSERYGLKLDIDDVKFEEIPAIKNKFSKLPFKGTIAASADLAFDAKDPTKSGGFLDLHVKNGVIGPGKYGAEIPLFHMGDIDARFVMEKGVLEVEKYAQKSQDMQSDAIGHITFLANMMASRVNIDWRFKFSDEMLKKNELLRMALATARPAEGTDHYYYYNVRGTLQNMQPVPNRAAMARFKLKNGEKGDKDKRGKGARAVVPTKPEGAVDEPPAAPPAGKKPTPFSSGAAARNADEMPPPAVPPTPVPPTPPPGASPGSASRGPGHAGGIREVKEEHPSAEPAEDENTDENEDNEDTNVKGKPSRRAVPANMDEGNTDENGGNDPTTEEN